MLVQELTVVIVVHSRGMEDGKKLLACLIYLFIYLFRKTQPSSGNAGGCSSFGFPYLYLGNGTL